MMPQTLLRGALCNTLNVKRNGRMNGKGLVAERLSHGKPGVAGKDIRDPGEVPAEQGKRMLQATTDARAGRYETSCRVPVRCPP